MSNPPGKGPRPVKMRASCDMCFHAKVKCSKQKPICARCMVNGNECQYSPSSRAGKPRADATRSASTQAHLSMYTPANTIADAQQMQMGLDQDIRPRMENFWIGQYTAGSSLYGLQQPGRMGVAPNPSQATLQPGSIPASTMRTWTPNHEQFAMPFAQFNGSVGGQYPPQSHSRSSSYDPMMTMSADSHLQATRDVDQMYDLNQTPLPTPPNNGISTLPFSPIQHQEAQPAMDNSMVSSAVESQGIIEQQALQALQASRGMDPARGTCTCFRTCILSLDSLHSASSKLGASSGDMIMKLNEKAVEGCLYMLNCPRCTDPIGTDAAWVLANIIDKISSLYKFVLDNSLQAVDIAAGDFLYTQSHTRGFLEQVMSQRLSILQEVRQKFTEQCMGLQDHLQVHSVLVNYVNSSMSWIDRALAMTSQAMGDEDNKSETGADFGFQF